MKATLPARKYPEPAARQFLIDTALQTAAVQTGVQINPRRRWDHTRGTSFRLALDDTGLRTPSGRYQVKNGERMLPRYCRTSWYSRRIVNAVCWHGHRDFFRALFAILPDLKVRTSMATYTGATFESIYRDTYYKNAGSQMQPAEYGSLCICSE